MNRVLQWWYRLSLPAHATTIQPTSPPERERQRYSKLTAGFLLLFLILYLPSGLLMLFDSPPGSSSPAISVIMFVILLVSFVCGKQGWQRLSAMALIAYTLGLVTGVLATNPLDPSLLPIVYTLLFAVLLAGALLPPVAALIVGVLNCLDIAALVTFVPHTPAYTAMMNRGLYSVLIFLPMCMQIGIAVMSYVILRNLLLTIRRADRAEEIVALQQEMAAYEESRLAQQAQLEEGIRKIADVHARVANGDFDARVSLIEGDVLWSVAVPLNNLLNRLQAARQNQEALMAAQHASRTVAMQLQAMMRTRQVGLIQPTGTILDPVILEINRLNQLYAKIALSSRSSS